MIAGVCSGLGEYFNIDPTLVRLLFVLGTLFGLGSFLVAYIVLAIVVPEEPLLSTSVTPPPAPVEPVEPVDTDTP
jgi:phage shock protein PspC (stress-responsive transcriptional regulator)